MGWVWVPGEHLSVTSGCQAGLLGRAPSARKTLGRQGFREKVGGFRLGQVKGEIPLDTWERRSGLPRGADAWLRPSLGPEPLLLRPAGWPPFLYRSPSHLELLEGRATSRVFHRRSLR